MQQDQLIIELQSGNEKAFERIYHLYSVSTYGIIYSIIRDEKVSEEVLQDVFLKIWNHAPTYDASKGRFLPGSSILPGMLRSIKLGLKILRIND